MRSSTTQPMWASLLYLAMCSGLLKVALVFWGSVERLPKDTIRPDHPIMTQVITASFVAGGLISTLSLPVFTGLFTYIKEFDVLWQDSRPSYKIVKEWIFIAGFGVACIALIATVLAFNGLPLVLYEKT
jgi:hypothetical protein